MNIVPSTQHFFSDDMPVMVYTVYMFRDRKTQECGHRISRVIPGSIAQELELEEGDRLVSINGEAVEDVFDYRFMIQEEELTVIVLKESGEEWELSIEKDPEEDLGLEFENGLMDEYRSCSNRCIFCFIDQMPPGMRKTLYFKDDDARLSFLQGNYITLTNLSEHDMERILRYRLSPVNVSFHTTNPELRCRMLGNRFAGEALEKARRLCAPGTGIEINGQIVLCRGINDGAELDRTLTDLIELKPGLKSVSVVPVGLTRFREGLFPLEPFTKEDAVKVLAQIRAFQEKSMEIDGTHFVHASDEWYLLAGEDIPPADAYDGYEQLENGVGMLRLLMDEFDGALRLAEESGQNPEPAKRTLVTGRLMGSTIQSFADRTMELYPQLELVVREIRNDFFGERITVSGLLTGQDIIAQLSGTDIGDEILMPRNLLRAGETVLLDDVTLEDIERELETPVRVIEDGYDLLDAMMGI